MTTNERFKILENRVRILEDKQRVRGIVED